MAARGRQPAPPIYRNLALALEAPAPACCGKVIVHSAVALRDSAARIIRIARRPSPAHSPSLMYPTDREGSD